MECDVCQTDFSDEKINKIKIKDKVKNVWEGCIAAIKGFA